MASKFDCKNCGKEIVTEYLQAGETTRCPNCGKMMTVPDSAMSFDLKKRDHVPMTDLRVRDFKQRISEIDDRPDEDRRYDDPVLRKRLKARGKSLLINLSAILILISLYTLLFGSLRIPNDMVISGLPALLVTLALVYLTFRGVSWARHLLAFTVIIRGLFGYLMWLRYLKVGEAPIVIAILAATLLILSGAILLFSRSIEKYIDDIAESKRR
jgi:hypothetical protein